MGGWARLWLASCLALAAAVGCADGSYDVVVRFDPPELGDSVERVEVAFVPGCDGQAPGEPPDAEEVVLLRRMATSGPMRLGSFEPGSYGLYARGLSDGCRVVASGCSPVELEAGGSGELVVVLGPLDGPGCAAGEACVEETCVAMDSGVPDGGGDSGDDGGAEAGLDGGIDGGRDGGDLDAGLDAGTDGGSDAGQDAGFDGGPMCGTCDDSNPCTDDACTFAGCVYTPDDTNTCGGGVCQGGTCCTGCWDGSSCQSGSAVTACGDDGAACVSCNDGNPCTDDFCTLSGCVHVSNDANTCGGGTCRDGACCTGCWDGAACRAGTAPAACGTSGGACAACACPTNACTAGSCAPADMAAWVGNGFFHACAVGSSGRLYCWGDNSSGQLGTGAVGVGTEELSPTIIGTATNWATAVGGQGFTCALRTDGSLYCWGDNDQGQLGQGDLVARQLPTRVGTAAWSHVTTGDDHACAWSSVGELWCWGEGNYGQLGLADNSDRRTPVQVPGTWSAASAGRWHTCGVRGDGTLWCWGRNNEGQLGVGDTVDRNVPVQVGVETDWQLVAGGEGHTCGLRAGGTLWCWGWNTEGQLGTGSTNGTAVTSPQQVTGASVVWDSFTVGEDHTCAIRSDGSLWCWGENDSGQLGDGTLADRSSPTRVGTANDWVMAVGTGGEHHVCGIRSGGSLWCWGANDRGQLAVGDTAPRYTPTRACFPLP